MNGFKAATGIVGIIVIGVIWYFIIPDLEALVLKELVYPDPNMTLEEWAAWFITGARYAVISSCILTLIWSVWSLAINIGKWPDTNVLRLYWAGLFIIAAIATGIIAFLYTPAVQAGLGKIAAYGFYLLNLLITYWLATALFSPPIVKYIPLGSKKIRFY